jgi:hypothetical protein
MSYTSLLHPRPEVLSEEGIEPIIDLANVSDARGGKLEARPDDFLSLTFPTNDMRRVVQGLNERFTGRPNTPGLYLFEGLKGSGKSHLLVTIYHLFQSPSAARQWLRKHELSCQLPSDAVIVLNKFTDQPLASIWDFIYLKLTGSHAPMGAVQPSLDEVKAVLGNRRLVLIFDELEQGIRTIGNATLQAQNIAFLQMLSEWGNRSDQVTLFASVYSDTQEPGNTLKRVAALRVQFAQASEADRARVVLHRLFENHLQFRTSDATPTVDSYINYWTRHQHQFSADEYRDRLRQTYPFTPDLLDLLLKRVPARGGFQNVRGALGFLANLVRLTHRSADLITAGHASLQDQETVVRLSDLDTTGDLVNRAQDNLRDLANVPLASEIAAATLLYTLAGTGRMVGATKEELLRAAARPGTDINDFERGLAAFQRYAANFHESAGLHFFDLEENPDAKVEFQALRREYEERAPAELRTLWQTEVFRESAAVVYSNDEAATREAIEQLDRGRVRWVLAPRRLTAQERHSLYYGLSARNEVILLEPKDSRFDLDRNADLLKWMRRSLAAADLAERTRDNRRKEDYNRIARTERGYITQAIRQAGLVYVRWIQYAGQPLADEVEEEPLGRSLTKDEVLINLGQNLYPWAYFAEHIGERLNTLWRRTVKEIDQQYRNTLGFPVPTHADRISKAIRQLCRDRKLSVNHQRGNYCGTDPALNDRELESAIIDAPLAEQAAPRPVVLPRPGLLPGTGSTDTSTPGDDDGTMVPIPLDVSPVDMAVAEQDIPTLPRPTVGELRQEIAERLQGHPEGRVTSVRFSVLLDRAMGDLSTLPAAYRGSLSGAGDITVEITVRRRGDFSKADVEAMAERLPAVAGAEYTAHMTVFARSDA